MAIPRERPGLPDVPPSPLSGPVREPAALLGRAPHQEETNPDALSADNSTDAEEWGLKATSLASSDREKPIAILNSRITRVNDRAGNCVVESIGPRPTVLTDGSLRTVLPMP
jgi:hypothetical protein